MATVHKAGDKWTWLPCGGDEQNPLSSASLSAREKLYRDGAARYAKDPSLSHVHAFVAPYDHSEEGFWGKKMPADAKAAQKRFILLCATIFPSQEIIWTGGPQDPAANREIIAYGVKVAPGRFGYKMNAMNPKDNFGWAGTSLLIDAAKMGANICFEAVQPSKHPNFGGTWEQFVAKVKEVERRAGKRFSYKAIYPEDLGKVAPSATRNRVGYYPPGDAKAGGNGRGSLSPTTTQSNVEHLGVRHCGSEVQFTKLVPLLVDLVSAIVPVSSDSKVLGIYAPRIVALVHDDQSSGHRSVDQFVGYSMGANAPAARAHAQYPVARFVQVSHPQNAAVGICGTAPFTKPFLHWLGRDLLPVTCMRAVVSGAFARRKDGAVLTASLTRNHAGRGARSVVALAGAEATVTSVAGALKRIEERVAPFAGVLGLGLESSSRAFYRTELPLASIEVTECYSDINPTGFALSFDHCWHDAHSIVDKRVASFYQCAAVQTTNWPQVKANIAAIEKQAGRKISYLAPYPTDLMQAGVK